MAHDKLYGICESKCKVEVPSLEQYNEDLSSLSESITESMVSLSKEDRDFLTKKMLINMGKEILTDCCEMYIGKGITTIDYLETHFVTNMEYMFYRCSSLTSIPELDTSNVTSMERMFGNCSSLTSIPELDLSSATNMVQMFGNCSSLTSIPKLDTSNVTNMHGMFINCTSLTSIPELDLSSAPQESNMPEVVVALLRSNSGIDVSEEQ